MWIVDTGTEILPRGPSKRGKNSRFFVDRLENAFFKMASFGIEPKISKCGSIPKWDGDKMMRVWGAPVFCFALIACLVSEDGTPRFFVKSAPR